MKKHRLMLSAATAALIAIPLAGAALADTDITTIVKTGQLTSTAGNISIESGGGVTIKSNTPAITLDSANYVLVNSGGVITNVNTQAAYGVLVDTSAGNILSAGGFGFDSSGTLDLSGSGGNKSGISIVGNNTFLGGITLLGAQVTGTTGSVINVEGDDSIAVYLARGTTMDGNMELGGSITQTVSAKNTDNDPTRLIGIDGVLNGSISVDPGAVLTNVGAGARGITILGAMHAANCTTDAALYTSAGVTCPSTTSYGSLVNSGTVATIGTQSASNKNANPESGAALVVGASIDGGIELSGPATGFATTVQGSFIGAGNLEPVVLFDPSQPAASGFFGVVAPITIGVINSTTDTSDGAPVGTTSCPTTGATPACYSFINHGQIRAQTLDSELSTTAMTIVGASSTNSVTFVGGLLDTGTISAIGTTNKQSHSTATDISATALYIGPYANIPNITVAGETTTGTATTAGNINAQVTGSGGGNATAILLGLGARVPTINVLQHATVVATVTTTTTAPTTDLANNSTPFSLISQAIVDQSGFLTQINNGGAILAANTQLDPAVGAVTNNIAHAINLSAGNGNNVTINSTGTILGDVLFGAASNNDVFNVGNVSTAVINATGNTATAGAYAVVAGRIDASFSGLPPTTELNTINFGSGTGDALNVGAFGYVNSIIKAASPGAVDISLATSGILAIGNAASDGTVNANGFNINGGTLIMPLAQTTTTTPVAVVTANSANIAAAATLSTQFTSFFSSGFTTSSVNNPTAQQIVLIKTPTGALTISPTTLDQDNAYLSANLPFLFRPTTTPLSYIPTVGASSELVLTLTPKTPAELGLTGDAAALFPNAAASLVSDPLLGAAIANNITVRDPGGAIDTAASKAKAQQFFSQFSPDVSGGARQVAIMLTDQATGPVAARQRLLRSYANQPGEITLWSDEFAGSINNKGRVDADGSLTNYKDHGFGFSVGMDAGSPLGGWYGGAFTFYTGDVSQTLPRTTKTDTQWYMLTAYTDWHGKHVFLDTKADVGYGDLVGHRDMTVGDQARSALGKRAGLVAAVGATAGVDLKYGGIGVMPHISLDGMTLRENGYYETGGQALDLQVAPYYGNSLRTAFGFDFKKALNLWDVIVTPEARFGYRYDLVSAPVKIKGGFISTGGLNATGNSFTFIGPDPDTGNMLAGFSLGAATDTWQLGLNYDWLRGNNGSTTQTGTLTILARI